MKIVFLGAGLIIGNFIFAQQQCGSFQYQQQLVTNDPVVYSMRSETENFIRQQKAARSISRTEQMDTNIIRIPVVFHILYHTASENLSDQKVKEQLDVLNTDFRKRNSDTTKIPSYFNAFAADCGFQFELAKVDPSGRATNGIIHKYTSVTRWSMDDKIKFSSDGGDNAWDATSYLNIWVGTMPLIVGYSSFPGDPLQIDGIVISNAAFGLSTGSYDKGRTAVHEIGHWLGLKHLWGDADCGEDEIDDTPKQKTFTTGCPTSARVSCNNGPYGDMYMNYMDFTYDNCLVMFTNGQRQRMRSLFEAAGPRNSLINSTAFGEPWVFDAPLPVENGPLKKISIYPNPAISELFVNTGDDESWMGKEIRIIDLTGRIITRKLLSSKTQSIDISNLKTGVYFITGENNQEKLLQKFIKH